jgi:uncharacterized YccA/Bax inhibitor family protein
MSTSIDTAFKRIDKEYRGHGSQQAPMGQAQTFSAARAYDKLIALATIVLVCAIAGWLVVPVGVAFACVFVAFGIVLVSWFRMRWAKVLAPAYAVTEGIALGAISAAYQTVGHGIVPVAIVFTAGVFVTALFLYRTGLVRVTHRMVAMASMGAVGLLAAVVLSLFIPGHLGFSSFGPWGIIIGVVCLGIAVLNLFTDFDYVHRSEQMGVSADAEWAAAFAMLTALVLVYLSILRILASFYGGGGGRRR